MGSDKTKYAYLLLTVVFMSLAYSLWMQEEGFIHTSSIIGLFKQAPLKANQTQVNVSIVSQHLLLSSKINNGSQTSDFSRLACFKNVSNASVDTTVEIETLITEYISPNKLKIFVPTYMRMPNIYENKCSIPMISFQISKHYYYIEDEFYVRKFDRSLCTKPEFCLPFDWIFLWKYILKHYPELEWFLRIEDDISFCPNLLNELFYYMNGTLNSQYKYVILGPGITGILTKVSFLKRMIQTMTGYPRKMHRLFEKSNHAWWKSPDTYLIKRLGNNVASVTNNAIYHPSGNETLSVLGHSYAWTSPTYCQP